MPNKLVDPTSTIADIVVKGRQMGYRDAAIRAGRAYEVHHAIEARCQAEAGDVDVEL